MKELLTYRNMKVNDTIFRELIKRGHSNNPENGKKIWDVADSKLWYLTPELSKGFLELHKFPPYRNLFKTEILLIQQNTPKFMKSFGYNNPNVIDLGCCLGLKVETFIKNLPAKVKMRYFPVDINPWFIEKAIMRISELSVKNVIVGESRIAGFDELAHAIIPSARNADYSHNLILLLGSIISHYDIHEFLYELSNSMLPQDMVVIGNGIRPSEGKRFVDIKKYKDPLFNSWFIHIMNGLGFNEDEVEYDARFTSLRLEAFYKVKVDKKVEHEGKVVQFNKGDEIIVAVQYKYYAKELEKFLEMYFKKVEVVKDKDEEFALFYCIK